MIHHLKTVIYFNFTEKKKKKSVKLDSVHNIVSIKRARFKVLTQGVLTLA